jgi:RNA polymerase sigma factor (sigma-70 family)
MHVDDDHLLVAKILKGKTDMFRILIDRYQRLVAHIVFRYLPNTTDREEICQEVFIKVFQNLSTFKFNSKISTWIGRIALNTCLNHMRKTKITLFDDLQDMRAAGGFLSSAGQADHTSSLPEPPDVHVEYSERSAKIQECIAQLPAPYRLIISLFHLDEMSLQEIAEITGIPEGTIKSHLFRGRKLLKVKLIAEYEGEEIWT